MAHTPLLLPTVAFCLGLAAHSQVANSATTLWAAGALTLCLSWILWGRKRAWSCWIVLLLAFCMSGMAWKAIHELQFDRNHLRALVRSGALDLAAPCRVRGRCVRVSDGRAGAIHLEVEVQHLTNRFASFETRGKIRLHLNPMGGSLDSSPLPQAGDQVEILAYLRRPDNFNNPGQFDYRSYLELRGIFLTGNLKDPLLLTRLTRQPEFSWKDIASRMRQGCIGALDALPASEPARAVLKAVLLGDDSDLAEETRSRFRLNGLYHVLVVSGLHVGMMIAMVFALLKQLRLPRWLALTLTMASIGLYNLLAEGQIAIDRASIMGCLFLASLYFDRDRNLLHSLCLAAWWVLLKDPGWLDDSGFQLSFSAALAIAMVGLPILRLTTQPYGKALRSLESIHLDRNFPPRLAAWRVGLRLRSSSLAESLGIPQSAVCLGLLVWTYKLLLGLLDIVLVSIAIQAVLLVPLMVYFHRVVLPVVFLNMLVIPLVGMIIPLGFSYLACAGLFPQASWPLGWICGLLAECLLSLNLTFSEIPWLGFSLPQFPLGWVLAYYGTLALCVAHGVPRFLRLLGSSIWIASLAVLLSGTPGVKSESQELSLTFLDVRQGDCLLASWPNGPHLLVDGGGSWSGTGHRSQARATAFDVGEQVVAPYLWNRGVRSLEATILTHAHQDHMGGLDFILDNFEVKEFWLGNSTVGPDLRDLLKKATARGLKIRAFQAGDTLNFHGSQLEFLNPGCGPSDENINNDSLVLRMTYGRRSFLLTGDIEEPVEECLAALEADLQSDVLKVAHHGSATSTSSHFLNEVNPVIAVISAGKVNPFGHPHPEVVRRLQTFPLQLLRTDRQGAVTIRTDGNYLRTSAFSEEGGISIRFNQ
ncbi:MAG: DNA internalization-related competence protein ComEC/Rec2 [Acidobacteriota bacterium]|nr:DNA internalization-related competence protein ComEC/Rec2 [Acidobacteriota bacterium]